MKDSYIEMKWSLSMKGACYSCSQRNGVWLLVPTAGSSQESLNPLTPQALHSCAHIHTQTHIYTELKLNKSLNKGKEKDDYLE